MNLVIPKFEGEHFFLSNFYQNGIGFPLPGLEDEGLWFKDNESAFQACKYKAMPGTDKEKVEYVVSCVEAKSPNEAKRLGRRVKIDTDKWDSIKIDVMREVCRVKFDDPKMRALLLATGPAMLVEGNTWGDTYWGRVDGKGYNMLGVILMELRGYYRLGE